MPSSIETQLTADGFPVFAHEIVDQAARAAADLLVTEGKSGLRCALVTGSHGAGKTTQLKLMDYHLREAGASVSWFSAWAHKEDVDPFASILFALWDQLDLKGMPAAPSAELVEVVIGAAMRRKGLPSNTTNVRARDTTEGGERALLAAVDLISQLVVRSQPIAELAHAARLLTDAASLNEDRFQQQKLLDRSRSYLFPRRLREQMELIVGHLRARTKDPHLPAFLFVDDLDRSPPKLGLALLEALGRFFTVPGLVIVVALDEAVARAWVNSAYEGNVDGRAYIDKLFDRRVLGVEERARVIWAQILGVEWRMAQWDMLVGKAHPEMADRAVISATRLLRIHGGSDIRKVRRTLAEVRTIIADNRDLVCNLTLMPDVVRLGVLCGYLVRERHPRVVERIADMRLLDARVEVIEEMMAIAPAWAREDTDDALSWLREFLELKPDDEREIGYMLDIRHFLPTDVLQKVGAQLVLLGMGLG
ncbi:MAG: hypothetical protein KF754_06165 [Planctomycetes bacterium]|nr:hypothetical protein [Planctomycetota bacterium]